MSMDRRQFLRVAMATAVTGLSVPLIGASDSGTDDGDVWALAYPDLLAVLGAERVSAMGAHYREATPAERDAHALRAAIAIGGRPDSIGHRTGHGHARIETAALVARDFAEERTVLVDGWVLSITEARQCALFSLLGR